MSRPGPEAARFHIPSLDGIRAGAFAIVFLAHVGWGCFPAAFGVTAFFFLSGYLITTLLRREFDRTGGVDLRSFYLRRVLRILPPFYLALFSVLLVEVLVDRAPLVWPAWAAQALQVSNYYTIFRMNDGLPVGLSVAWSLAVEEHFYLIFPVAYLLLRRRFGPSGQAAGLLAACGLVLAWRCVLSYGLGATEWRIYAASDARADALLFGCVLAVVGNPALDPAGPARRRWDLALVPVAILVIGVAWAVPDEHFHRTFRYTLQSLAMIPLFTAAVRYPRFLLFRPLNSRPARWLGGLSYSLYLVHLSVIDWLQSAGLSRVPLTLASLAISMALAAAMYRWVEQPCARLRRSLEKPARLDQPSRLARAYRRLVPARDGACGVG